MGYLLPGPVMATLWDRIEGIAFQEVLKGRDAKMKIKYADQFSFLRDHFQVGCVLDQSIFAMWSIWVGVVHPHIWTGASIAHCRYIYPRFATGGIMEICWE
jgi:hypothetical protein